MPVTFKSQATGNLVMLSAHAEALLRLLGKTAAEPGILEVADMALALATLRALDPELLPELPVQAVDDATPDADSGHHEDKPPVGFQDEPVSLRQRAAPLVRLIEQAQAGGQPIVWGV